MKHTASDIGQIAITVSDVEALLPYYRDVLGLTFLFSPSPNLAFLSAGSVRIMPSTPEGAGEAGRNSILYFKVTNVEEVHSAKKCIPRSWRVVLPASGHPSWLRRCPTTSSG